VLDPADKDNTAGLIDKFKRTTERPKFDVTATEPSPPNPALALAKVTVDGSGNINTIDPSVRKTAGSVIAPSARGVASLNSVSNPGGNIDLISDNSILITPDDPANRITIKHDLGKRVLASVSFTQGDADGATRTITLNFPVKLVKSVGIAKATLAGAEYGGGISGFYDVALNQQRCCGIIIGKNFTNEWASSAFIENAVGASKFSVSTAQPPTQPNREDLKVEITSVTATSFVARLSRTRPANTLPISSFEITLHLLCMGLSS
jgi:hypothetical protein